MLSLRCQKAVSLLLTAVFAVYACGNVAMHRITAWHQCGCFEHATRVETPTCACGHHTTEKATPSTEPQVSGHSDCPISKYFRQAIQVPSPVDVVGLSPLCDFYSASDSTAVESALLLAFWSRGPPMSC